MWKWIRNVEIESKNQIIIHRKLNNTSTNIITEEFQKIIIHYLKQLHI